MRCSRCLRDCPAAMHGQEATAKLLLSKADNLEQVLLTPNKDGLTVYALALQVITGDSHSRC